MKKVLVIKQVLHEGPGIIGMELLRLGIDMVTVEVYNGEVIPETLDGYAALIVLGGPMGVYEEEVFPFITEELRLIRHALKESVPVLGVCLGSQLLARAAGAKVYRGTVTEIGFYSVAVTEDGRIDPLTRGLTGDLSVFQWHGDTFDLPEAAALLASSKTYPQQMFRVGRAGYGIQFHLEVTVEMVIDWVERGREEIGAAGLDAEAILSVAAGRLPGIHKNGVVVIRRFLGLLS